MDDKKEKIPTGWECPRCHSINAPEKDKCQCVKVESTETKSVEFLTE